jgi:pyruvate kinase
MNIRLPLHKTKIVCTIGPASRNRTVLKKMIAAGMNVARLNFSHGEPEEHKRDMDTIRELSATLGKPVAILADLPGPKIRLGMLKDGSVMMKKGEITTLTTRDVSGTHDLIPVQFKELPKSVTKGGMIYLNDGFVQLKVMDINETDVRCRVFIGGQLLSHKGLNLPGAHIDIDAVTAHDLELLKYAIEAGVDAVGVSFVKSAADIIKIKEAAKSSGRNIHVVAKIERIEAFRNIDSILEVADGIMVARGDLGVETPIENVPILQKELIFKANLKGKPVITATQMLESMTDNIRPTRAEVTDVANAILDGTDAVMLSEEAAIGKYPAETVAMMAKIAASTEKKRFHLAGGPVISQAVRSLLFNKNVSSEDVISLDALEAINSLKIKYVLAPTRTGGTPRRISRYKPDTWIIPICQEEDVRNFLLFSYGTLPILYSDTVSDDAIIDGLRNAEKIKSGDRILIVRRLPEEKTGKVNSLKIVTLA